MTTSIDDYGITSTGLRIMTLAEIKADYEAAYKEAYGEEIDLSPSSPEGNWIGIESEREALIWELIEAVYNSQYPDTAFGTSLDNVNAINAVERLGESKSIVTGQGFFGTEGTVIPVGTIISVQNNSDSRFVTQNEVTLGAGVDAEQTIAFSDIPDAGYFKLQHPRTLDETDELFYNSTYEDVQAAINALDGYSGSNVVAGSFAVDFTVTFGGDDGKQPQDLLVVSENTLTITGSDVDDTVTASVEGEFQGTDNLIAEDYGPDYVANARTLTVIETPVTGLDSTYNPSDADIGRDIETDADYKIRRRTQIATTRAGTLEGIYNALAALNEDETKVALESIKGFENTTNAVDARGLPAKSFGFWIYQAGGVDDRDQEIADAIWSAKPGGIETYGSVEMTATDSMGFDHTIKFSRPTEKDIYLILNLTTTSDYPDDGDDQVLAAILEWGNSLGIGQDVVLRGYNSLICQLDEIPGITDVEALIGIAPNPTQSVNIDIDDGTGGTVEMSVWDSSRITINS